MNGIAIVTYKADNNKIKHVKIPYYYENNNKLS